MKFFDKTPSGSITNRLSNDVFSLDDYLPWNCHVLIEELATSLGYPIGILIFFPWMITFIFITFILIYYV